MPYIGNPAVVGDSANTFKLLDDIASYTLTFDGSSASVVSVANDTLTFNDHRFVNIQRVTYTKGGGTVITGLTDNTAYYVIKVDQNTIKLATSSSNAEAGTGINLTGLGAGTTHTLKIAFDGTNTKFKATHSNGTKAKISRAAQLTISINGVNQQPQETSGPTVGYGIAADSTIVFSQAPVSTDKVFGTFIGEVAPSFDITDNTIDEFTANGSTTLFTLSKEATASRDVLVTLDGVTQYPNTQSDTRAYSIADNSLIFTTAPAAGVVIQARHIGHAGAVTSAVSSFQGRTGAITIQDADPIVAIQSSSTAIGNVRTLNFVGTGNTFLQRGNVIDIAIAGGGAGAGGTWASSPTGVSTTKSIGINTSTADDPDLVGVGNSFQGLYIGNGMIIVDNQLNGNHYIGTNFNGIMGGPVTVNGVLSVDGNYVVV